MHEYAGLTNRNKINSHEDICKECRALWRSFRNNTSVNHLKTIEHTRILKKEKKKYSILDNAFTEHKNGDKKKWSLIHKQQNKLIKKVSYWKKNVNRLRRQLITGKKLN